MSGREFLGLLVCIGLILLVAGFSSEQAIAAKFCVILEGDPTEGVEIFSLPRVYDVLSEEPPDPDPDPSAPCGAGVKNCYPWKCGGGGFSQGTKTFGVYGVYMNLDYLRDYDWDSGVDGNQCFPPNLDPDNNADDAAFLDLGYDPFEVVKGQVKVAKSKKADYPTGTIWIHGKTTDNEDMLYMLEMAGSFYFPPVEENPNPTDCPTSVDDPDFWMPNVGCTVWMRFDTWEMKTEGRGKDRKKTCRGGESIPSGRPLAFVALHRLFE